MKQKSKKGRLAAGLIAGGTAAVILALLFIGYRQLESRDRGREADIKQTLTIEGTDKARYAPGEEVVLSVTICNEAKKRAEHMRLDVEAYFLGESVDSSQESLSLEAGERKSLSLSWHPPKEDYRGYLLEVRLSDQKGRIFASETIGVDVSSSWVKFPRYGYVCQYGEQEETEEKIARMNRYHINAIEYYDWHALHHEPLPPSATKEAPGVWEDWSGRTIYGETIKRYLKAAKERNMINMAYNMIYAGTDSFVETADGKPGKGAAWQLFFAPENDRGSGAFSFSMGQSPSGNGNLYFMNPLNPEWQEYIFSKQNEVFEILKFDGWHGDTVGDWGRMTDASGNPLGTDEKGEPIYEVKETYRPFLKEAKQALGEHYLSFNPVGAQGIEQANTSAADVLYAEFWPWDNDRNGVPYITYASLAAEVERAREESKPYSFDGKGKSLVVKAYINYNNTKATMNLPGVLLCDAAVYAAGGSRLELGNGSRMLHREYYPDDTIPMGEELERQMEKLADFTVAYENLLRDGQEPEEHTVVIEGYPTSPDGQYDTIWTYTKTDGTYELLHLINLLGTDSAWRDEYGEKPAPREAADFVVKYYTKRDIKEVRLASFSIEGGRSQELEFEAGEDETGHYLIFSVPELTYWDMIYMREKER